MKNKYVVCFIFCSFAILFSLFAETDKHPTHPTGYASGSVNAIQNKIDQKLAPKSRGAVIKLVKKDFNGAVIPNDFFYYRSLLTEKQQKAYDELYTLFATGALTVQPTIPINCKELDEIICGLEFDSPELFWFRPSYSYSYNNDGTVTSIAMNRLDIPDFEKAKKAFVEKTEPVLFFASKLDTDMDKVKYVHDYLCKTIEYDYDALNSGNTEGLQTAYSAIINGRTVCTGYAKSFLYYMQRLHIPAAVIISSTHAWNMVKINNSTYEIDVCWDDGETSNNYFNLVHSDMRKIECHNPVNDSLKVVNLNPSNSTAMEYKNIFGNTPLGSPYSFKEIAHYKADDTAKPILTTETAPDTSPNPTVDNIAPQPTANATDASVSSKQDEQSIRDYYDKYYNDYYSKYYSDYFNNYYHDYYDKYYSDNYAKQYSEYLNKQYNDYYNNYYNDYYNNYYNNYYNDYYNNYYNNYYNR